MTTERHYYCVSRGTYDTYYTNLPPEPTHEHELWWDPDRDAVPQAQKIFQSAVLEIQSIYEDTQDPELRNPVGIIVLTNPSMFELLKGVTSASDSTSPRLFDVGGLSGLCYSQLRARDNHLLVGRKDLKLPKDVKAEPLTGSSNITHPLYLALRPPVLAYRIAGMDYFESFARKKEEKSPLDFGRFKYYGALWGHDHVWSTNTDGRDVRIHGAVLCLSDAGTLCQTMDDAVSTTEILHAQKLLREKKGQ